MLSHLIPESIRISSVGARPNDYPRPSITTNWICVLSRPSASWRVGWDRWGRLPFPTVMRT